MLKKSKFIMAICLISGLMSTQVYADSQIIPVAADDLRVTRKFSALGDMYQVKGGQAGVPGLTFQVDDLIWSGVSGQQINQQDAVQFCLELGGDSRLPTWEEYFVLSKALGYPLDYNKNLMSGMGQGTWIWFWSSSVSPQDARYGYGFYGDNGSIWDAHLVANLGSVRCVRAAQ